MKITRAAIDAMKPGQELAYIWDSDRKSVV